MLCIKFIAIFANRNSPLILFTVIVTRMNISRLLPTGGFLAILAGIAMPVSAKWLPTEIHTGIRLLDCSYDRQHLRNATPLVDSRRWSVDPQQTSRKIFITALNDSASATTTTYRFIAREDMSESGVAVAYDFSDWSSDNYVMIPASVYNGNRQRIVNRRYATGLDPTDYDRRDLALTSNPIPQLNPDFGVPSLLEVSVCNAATPAIAILDRRGKEAVILLTEQGIPEGDAIHDHALIVEESADRSVASAVIAAPGVRGKKPEFIGFSDSPDRAMNFVKGDTLTISVTEVRFPALNTNDLLCGFMNVRKYHTSPTSREPRNFYPMSRMLEVMNKNIDNRYFVNDSVEFYRPEGWDWMAYGWIGGLINTYPMIALGDQEHLRRVSRTFDFALPQGKGESGYYYDILKPDGCVEQRDASAVVPGIGLTRRNGDVLYWMVKQLELLKATGHSAMIKPMWESESRRLADSFLNTWEKYGSWGGYIHVESGEPATYNTSGGASAVAGMALASRYFNDPRYLLVAGEAARNLYDNFAVVGFTSGGCGDILQNADSETAIALATAMVTLYEITGNKEYLAMGERLADLCATWTVSFDYRLPPDLMLAKTGANMMGAVWASTQNKHGAPGFCTLSGDALFKLYRAGAKREYGELLRDIIHAHAEGIQPDGTINERLTYCDADSRGYLDPNWKTGWNETNGALMALEIPGIYVRGSRDLMVFDHAEARIIKSDSRKVTLEITNPTAMNATYTVMAETEDSAETPLGDNAFVNRFTSVNVKAGKTKRITLPY